jgi:hypothetical protein
MWMNLKAKLYILKNHTFLLLGPSPFEHWLESYLYITVRSLLFYDIALRSSIFFLESPSSSASARARDPPPPASSRAPAALRRPSTRHPTTPPTARAAFTVLPSPCHVGSPMPSGCHAPQSTPAPPAVLGSARDYHPPLSPSPLQGRALL